MWDFRSVRRDSDELFDEAAGVGVDAEGVVDGLLMQFGGGGLAQVQGAAVGATERGGDAASCGEAVAQGGPTVGEAVVAQASSNDLDELIGDDGDEQMALGASGDAVVDGSEAEFGFPAAEHGLEARQRSVGPPVPFGVPVGEVGPQAVHAGQRMNMTG